MRLDPTDSLLDDAEDLLERLGIRGRRSETSFLQGLLGDLDDRLSAVGLSPADLFRAVRYGRPLMPGTRPALDLLAMPSQRPRDTLRPGDWVVRAVPGTGDIGHVAVLASDDLLGPSELAAQGIAAETTEPGYYGLVIEAGAFPHSRARPFARRVLDRRGRVLPHTVVLRPRRFAAVARAQPLPAEPLPAEPLPAVPPPDEPEPDGQERALDVGDAEEFGGCPAAEAEAGEQLAPPDSPVANRFVTAHSSRFCTPGQAGSATCQALVAPRPIRRVVIHVLAVPSTARRSGTEAVVAGWQNAGRQASAHYLVDRDGTITQMVREADVAFHTPGNNADSIGIEHADVCNDPTPLTTQLYERSAELVRDLATRHAFAINNNTVAGHSQVNPNHGDPGPYWDWEYFRLLLAWDGRDRAGRPVRVVTAAASRPAAPAGWQLQRRRVIANDHCASQRDPWGATYWRAQPSATGAAAELSLVVDEACTYKVSLWWPDVAGANPAVPVEIEVACLTSPCSGTSTQSLNVNQRPNAGRWNDVAVVNVTQTPAEVKVRWRRNSAERGWILVDAVRLLKTASCPAPASGRGAGRVEAIESELPGIGEDLTYEQILDRVRQELNLRFTDPDDPGLLQRRRRLRDLFGSVPASRTRELHAQLGPRPTGDELSRLFHRRLATATRRQMLKILEDRFPAATPPAPAPTTPPTTATNPCQRAMSTMRPLLAWERGFLAFIHDRSEADFRGVGVLIGPIIIPGLMPFPLDAIVRTALQKNYAITIDTNIWFPRAIDTSTIDDLVWLAHESVHVVDYAVAGVEAFLKTYVQQAIVQRFRHDDIPHEQRANRMEAAVRGMLAGSPDLVRAITSCDGNAILTLLQNQKDALRTALNQSM